MSPEPASYWTAVANIVRERPYGPGGAEIRLGTKHFAPGAKVYIIDWFPGTCERITVVGLHRKAKHMIAIVIDVKLVENLRAKVCYAPAVVAKIKDYYSQQYNPAGIHHLTQEFAETVCRVVPFWQAQPWRHQPSESPEIVGATLELLRANDSSHSSKNEQSTSASAPPEFTPKVTPTSFLHKLWLSIRFLLKD